MFFMPCRWSCGTRPLKKMDTAVIVAVVCLAFIGAAVGGTVRALLATYMAPWGCNEVVAPEVAAHSAHLPAGVPISSPQIELASVASSSATVTVADLADTVTMDAAPAAAASVTLAAGRNLAETGSTSPCIGDFPAATFTANVIGCFILGLLTQLSIRLGWPPYVLAALGTGFCGGLTTMSSFIIDTLKLIYAKNGSTAAVYWVSTQAACMLAGWIGWLFGTLAPVKQVAP